MKKFLSSLMFGLTVTTLVMSLSQPAKAEQNFYEVTVRKNLVSQGNTYVRGLNSRFQAAPSTKTGVATITIADMVGGIITLNQTTAATVALTVDTGVSITAGLPTNFAVGDSIDFSIINLDTTAAANTGTLTANTGVTLVGAVVIPSGHSSTIANSSMRFRLKKMGSTTYVIYKI